MLPEPKLKTLFDLISTSTREELIWINGYLAGVMASSGERVPEGAGQQPPAADLPVAVKKISIVFGTETGNSKKVATGFAARAKKKGINVKLTALDQYRLTDLNKEEFFFTVISTQGDGEPPATAKKFYDHLQANNLSLSQLKYGVLALGDTSYPLFCKAGEDVDERLHKLGATRIVPLQKCDTEYEADADHWFEQVLRALAGGSNGQGSASGVAPAPKKTGHKKNYTGTIITNVDLNDRGSSKQTHHIEIAVDGEIDYSPGDSVGILPQNKPATVEAILHLAGMNPQKKVSWKNEHYTAGELLAKKLNILYLPPRVVQKYAQLVQQEIPDTRIDLLDLLRIYPVKHALQFEEVLGILEPIAPRLYSISSSPQAHSGEVHITVARDSFCVNNETKNGLCSDYLSQFAIGQPLEFYVHPNKLFRLPAAEKDVIMIGPGTGIAPFRSFLSERDATGAEGRNWLFFGDQHFRTDFLYQAELQNFVQTGVLSRINVAFSRDQQYKLYVQHKMLEHGKELYNWLEGGAHLYICGAKEPMSVDVEYTLLQIVERFGGKTETEAVAYLAGLKDEERYVKDVY